MHLLLFLFSSLLFYRLHSYRSHSQQYSTFSFSFSTLRATLIDIIKLDFLVLLCRFSSSCIATDCLFTFFCLLSIASHCASYAEAFYLSIQLIRHGNANTHTRFFSLSLGRCWIRILNGIAMWNLYQMSDVKCVQILDPLYNLPINLLSEKYYSWSHISIG